MTAQHPAAPESEPGARGLREAVEAFAAAHDNENWRQWGIPQGLRALLAEHTPEATEGEREDVCDHPSTTFVSDAIGWECYDCAAVIGHPAEPDAGDMDVEALAKAAEADVWALADELCKTWHDNDGEVEGATLGLSGWLTSRWACQDCYDTACTLVDTKWLAATADGARREGARVVCTNCDADDLGCTACGAHGTLSIARSTP